MSQRPPAPQERSAERPAPAAALGRSRKERWLYAIALLLFVGALAVAYRNLPGVELRWPWLAVTAAIVPFVFITNGLEYYVAGSMLGHRIGLGEAIRVTILSSAANLLPLPGALLLRTEALKRRGATYRKAFSSNSAVGAGWVGTAALIAGALLLYSGQRWAGLVFGLGGLLGLLAMMVLVRMAAASSAATAVRILAVEAAFVLLSAVRMWGALHGLGVDASFIQATALTVATALAAAAGIFPGGLGLREIIAGGLSLVVGLPAAAGVLGAAVDRLIGLAIVTPLAGVLALVPGAGITGEETRASSG